MSALLLAIFLLAAPEVPLPYELKGVSLGITFEEFKQVPVPIEFGRERDEASRAQFKQPPLERRLTHRCSEKGTILRCNWVKIDKPTVKGFGEMPDLIETPLGGHRGTIGFDFVNAEDNVKRLSRITVLAKNVGFSQLSEAFIEKFGTPKQTVGTVQNSYGASFENISLTWNNGVSEILMQSRCSSIDTMCAIFSDLRLQKDVDANEKAAARKNSADL